MTTDGERVENENMQTIIVVTLWYGKRTFLSISNKEGGGLIGHFQPEVVKYYERGVFMIILTAINSNTRKVFHY